MSKILALTAVAGGLAIVVACVALWRGKDERADIHASALALPATGTHSRALPATAASPEESRAPSPLTYAENMPTVGTRPGLAQEQGSQLATSSTASAPLIFDLKQFDLTQP